MDTAMTLADQSPERLQAFASAVARFNLLNEIELLESSLIDFVEAAWPWVDSADYQRSWAVDAICDHLQAVTDGRIRKLLVTCLPGAPRRRCVRSSGRPGRLGALPTFGAGALSLLGPHNQRLPLRAQSSKLGEQLNSLGNHVRTQFFGGHAERRFNLADFVEVDGASYESGLLRIDLIRRVPEAMKPRKIAIGNVTTLPKRESAKPAGTNQAA